jgi:cytochrome P450
MTATPSEIAAHTPLLELQPDAIACPYPHFARMRDAGPVHEVPELGFVMVTRYKDVLEIARKPEVFSSRLPTGPAMAQTMMQGLMEAIEQSPDLVEVLSKSPVAAPQPVLLMADPPLHTRQRSLVARAFAPKRVAEMDEGIRVIAEALVDEFIDDGRVELVRQFAVTLPLIVIADALGVPRDELPTFKLWSDDFVVAIGNHTLSTDRLVTMMKSQAAFADYFREKIAERRAEPRDDLISDIVHARLDDGEELSEDEMLGMFSQFLVAGNETTTKMLASGMRLLLDHPDQMELVRSDESLLPVLVDEVLRLESPVQGLFRTANVDTEVGGVPVAAGTHLMLVYASGNRDEEVFADADRFDVTRANAKAHLAFGQGPHFCIGAALARAEGRIGFEVLLRRLANIRYAAGNTFEYEESYVLHGLKELHLEFDRA